MSDIVVLFDLNRRATAPAGPPPLYPARVPTGPFGGEKNSGIGRFGGEWIIRELTRDHWITVRKQPTSYPF